VYFFTNNQQINTSLNTLDLQYNTIGTDGAKAIAEALKVSYGFVYTSFLTYLVSER
jgi:Ran GTPase-activating protein (RanGAP) involved in mRNA processing and transport